MQSKQLYASVITLLICFGSAASQRPRATAASEFNIEIINLDGHKHFFSIPESPGRAGYIAHNNLNHIQDWKISETAPEKTNALRLQFWIEAGMPQIEVLAHLGNVETRPYEWGKQPTTKIVSRQLPIDETITLTETAAFGIVPFQVRVFLPLLEKMSGTAEPGPARLKKLKNDINALSEEVDTKVAEELIAQFAEASEDMRNRRIKVEIARGLGYIKNEVIQEIDKFERQREISPAKTNFESWLKELISMLGKMVRDDAFL